jgi:hypothetical protein
MSATNRRTFMLRVAAGSAALACTGPTGAALKQIEENEPKAMSLGYRHESAKVDKAKFPKHGAAEKCSNCMAWLGKPTQAWAECDLMADRIQIAGHMDHPAGDDLGVLRVVGEVPLDMAVGAALLRRDPQREGVHGPAELPQAQIAEHLHVLVGGACCGPPRAHARRRGDLRHRMG